MDCASGSNGGVGACARADGRGSRQAKTRSARGSLGRLILVCSSRVQRLRGSETEIKFRGVGVRMPHRRSPMTLAQFLGKQFIDVIQWNEPAPGILAWRYPMLDQEIQNGGRLTVRETEMALFV